MGLERGLLNGKRILLAGYSSEVDSVYRQIMKKLHRLGGVVSTGIFDLAREELQQSKYDLIIIKVGLSRYHRKGSVSGFIYEPAGGSMLVDALREQTDWQTPSNAAVLMVEDVIAMPVFLREVRKSLAGC